MNILINNNLYYNYIKLFEYNGGIQMKYSLPKNYVHSFVNDGILYFAQRLEEMLFDYTIDLYRMPLLNTHGLIYEYCDILKKVNSGETKEYQLNAVFDELVSSLKHDIILKEYWGSENITRIIKSFGSCSKSEKANTVSYLKAIMGSRRYYFWCVAAIEKYTNMPKEKKKLEAILRCFVPELVSMGYEPSFLYNTVKKHFFTNQTFSSNCIKDFLKVFDLKNHNYTVYFSVSKTVLKFKNILETRLNIQFEDDGNFKYFKIDRNKVIISYSVSAICPNTAAKITYNILNMFFSVYKFIGDKKSLAIQEKAMVIEKDCDPVFVPINIMSYNIMENGDVNAVGKISESLITGLLANARSEFAHLMRAIELHNTALAIPDLKSGFLNLWSSIELLCKTPNDDNKLHSVLPILKSDYLFSIIANINSDLQDNIPEKVYKEIFGQIEKTDDDILKLYYILFLDKYDMARKKLIKELFNYPVLRSRISLWHDMRKTKALKIEIDRYIQRIEWHLYRMYRTRNSIIHSGETPANIKYLGEHLHSYVDNTLSVIIIGLLGDIPFKSISDILIDQKFKIEIFDTLLQKGELINEDAINTLISS